MAEKRPLRVHVLALPECTTFVPVGMIELLRKSIELASATPGLRVRRPVELRLVAPARTITGAGGLTLSSDATLADAGPCDLVIAPALDPELVDRLDKNRAAVKWLAQKFRAGADVASACTGSFLLAEAGILDGRTATTHWAFQTLFAARYPRVRLAPQAVLVDQGRVVTAGGATSFVNLALFLVERLLGADVARAASKMFLVDVNKSPQGAYAIFSTQKAHSDEAILRVQTSIEAELAEPPSVDDLARRARMSRRNFARRFVLATGNTPRVYLQRVRIEAAKRALETTGEPVSAIADGVGYRDAVAFRKLFVRLTGLTPAEYRSRYGERTAPGWRG